MSRVAASRTAGRTHADGLPDGWKAVRLIDVFERVRRRVPEGVTHALSITATVGFVDQRAKFSRLIAGQSLSKYVLLKRGDFSYNKGNSKSYPQGCVYRLSEYDEGAVPNVYYSFRASSDAVEPEFYKHYFESGNLNPQLRPLINSGIRNDGLLNLDAADFFGCVVPLPPLPEQRKIAAVLSSVDGAIENTEALIAKLRDLRIAMMQELLTRGIGHTRFKALGDWQVGRIAAIREIPESWQLVPIAEVARLESGHTPDRDVPEYWNGGVPWISLHDTKTLWQRVVHTTSMTVTADGIKNSSARLLPAGTVCLSRTASIGHCVIMGTVMATSQDFANYVCGERLHNRYLLHLFRSMGHTWDNLSSGSTHQTVYMPIFEQLQILVPPLAEQLRIAAIADSLDDAVERRQGKLASLQSLKKALMQDLLTGRVRVKV